MFWHLLEPACTFLCVFGVLSAHRSGCDIGGSCVDQIWTMFGSSCLTLHGMRLHSFRRCWDSGWTSCWYMSRRSFRGNAWTISGPFFDDVGSTFVHCAERVFTTLLDYVHTSLWTCSDPAWHILWNMFGISCGHCSTMFCLCPEHVWAVVGQWSNRCVLTLFGTCLHNCWAMFRHCLEYCWTIIWTTFVYFAHMCWTICW